MSDHQWPEAGQSTPESAFQLKSLSPITTEDSFTDIILVGDISKHPLDGSKIWGHETEFFWPEKIPHARVSRFNYVASVVNTHRTREEVIRALREDILPERIKEQARDLDEYIKKKGSAAKPVLVGYGYGGLLCEQFIVDYAQDFPSSEVIKGLVLFGTPHFIHGLRQWARIVVETRAQSEASLASTSSITGIIGRAFTRGRASSRNLESLEADLDNIAKEQQSFLNKTKKVWDTRIASCFPVLSSLSRHSELSILPEWSTVPHAKQVIIRKPYLEMTAFNGENDEGYKVISSLIGGWIKKTKDHDNVPNKEDGVAIYPLRD
ncbi:hypothetical protein F5Y10DRAFT_273741 [Nemania abortiva]|nr:hypothetical protein F5Y10DRAFT_273741 [Nemania abortiva]